MDSMKNMWRRQDWVNRIILISGLASAVTFLVKGQGGYGIVVVLLMGMLCIARTNGRVNRLMRLYGSLYYHAPDGEIVPMSFDQVRRAYGEGKGGTYMGRPVTLRFPYWSRNTEGQLETGFGLCVDLTGFADEEGLLPTLQKGQYISVTGELVPQGKQYFYLGNVTELRRISEKELYLK